MHVTVLEYISLVRDNLKELKQWVDDPTDWRFTGGKTNGSLRAYVESLVPRENAKGVNIWCGADLFNLVDSGMVDVWGCVRGVKWFEGAAKQAEECVHDLIHRV